VGIRNIFFIIISLYKFKLLFYHQYIKCNIIRHGGQVLCKDVPIAPSPHTPIGLLRYNEVKTGVIISRSALALASVVLGIIKRLPASANALVSTIPASWLASSSCTCSLAETAGVMVLILTIRCFQYAFFLYYQPQLYQPLH
jgi:hypothetical protein